jgi:hypothetical protein
MLVGEDKGAAAHNGPFAKKVLDEAEAALDQVPPRL